MCRAKDDPRGWYRCDWGQYVQVLVDEGVDAVLDQLSGAGRPQRDIVRAATRDLAEVALEAATEKPECLRVARAGRTHFICSLAASIGDACHSIGDVSGLVADAIAQATFPRNPILAAIVRRVVKRWIEAALVTGTPMAQVAAIGRLADMIAVDVCPKVGRHPEVQQAERRLAEEILAAEPQSS